MLEFLFDLPLLITGPAIILLLCAFAASGLLLVRCCVLPRLRIHSEDSHFAGAILHCVMIFYGLAVALIAVGVWETYTKTTEIVSQEATSVAGLYLDVSCYPEPTRSQLQNELRNYVDQVIHAAWPLQRRGEIPAGGVELMNRFQAILASFEPATEGQKVLHSETFSAYNQMIQARRLRLDAVGTGLPNLLWFVIVVGAVLSLTASFFFKIEDLRLHLIQVTLLAAFVGLVIFMIFALDRPFRGDLGVRPDAYQLVYDHLMKP